MTFPLWELSGPLVSPGVLEFHSAWLGWSRSFFLSLCWALDGPFNLKIEFPLVLGNYLLLFSTCFPLIFLVLSGTRGLAIRSCAAFPPFPPSLCLFLSLFFWLPRTVCGILVPQPGTEPAPPAVEARSLNHWAAREVSLCLFLSFTFLACFFDSLSQLFYWIFHFGFAFYFPTGEDRCDGVKPSKKTSHTNLYLLLPGPGHLHSVPPSLALSCLLLLDAVHAAEEGRFLRCFLTHPLKVPGSIPHPTLPRVLAHRSQEGPGNSL